MFMNSLFGESLFDEFFNDFDSSFSRPMGALISRPSSQAVMRTDVKENEANFELDIDLPGYKKDDVKAELKDGYLTVSAVRKSSNNDEAESGKYLRRERYYGACSRSFYVGEALNQNDIKAKFEDGILKLTVPKKEPEIPEPSYIAIEG